MSVGARVAASLPGVDLSAYYHYGYDSTPYVTFDADFLEFLYQDTLDADCETDSPFDTGLLETPSSAATV